MFMGTTPFITVRARRPLTEIEFCAWVAQAVPGDRLEYHRGFLVLDIFPMFARLPDRAARGTGPARVARLLGRRTGPRAPGAGAHGPRPVRLHRRRPPQTEGRSRLAVRASARRAGAARPRHRFEWSGCRVMTAFQSLFADHGDPYMPFPANTPTVDDLPGLGLQDIAQLPVELLAILQRDVDERIKRDKAAKARLDGALTVRYATRAADERQAAGKDTGTIRFDDGDFTVVADLPKRVDWDQDRLAAMVERIRAAGDDPAQYVDIAFKVPERKYAAWPDAIRAGFEPARTVRPGTLKIEIVPQGGDQ